MRQKSSIGIKSMLRFALITFNNSFTLSKGLCQFLKKEEEQTGQAIRELFINMQVINYNLYDKIIDVGDIADLLQINILVYFSFIII